jgi:hypothetical protein
MSKVNTYKSYNQAIKTALAWKEMIGKDAQQLMRFDCEMGVCKEDFSTDEVSPSREFTEAMNKVLMQNRHVLIGKAFEAMEAKRKALLQEAQDEYTALMQEV